MDFQTEAELKVALGFLQQGNPLEAQKIISSLFEHDLESMELVYTNKCCIFWIDSIRRLKGIDDAFERTVRSVGCDDFHTPMIAQSICHFNMFAQININKT